LALITSLAACGGGGDSPSGNSSATTQSQGLTAMAQLGEKIFNDQRLSANGNQACASCHVAAQGHAGAPNSVASGLGSDATELGSDGHSLGGRVSPSIRYLGFNKAFRFEADGTPTGGFFLDGRADSLAEQGKKPFLNPVEMANADVAAVITRLASAAYANEFKALFGQDIFIDPNAAFDRVALALQAFQKEASEFAPFSSKYDAFLRGQTSLTSAELRGLAWFNSADKGNCKACHPSAKSADGTFPLFTDFSFDALGVPKNWDVPGSHGDRGLCDSGLPAVEALSSTAKDALCGAFKVPSLRNVGLRKAYFHNGKFRNLTDVVTFYVQRDTNPEKWYRDINGQPDVKFNDLRDFKDNVNTTEAPYNRDSGDEPALNADEINEVVAFLCTLSDGWTGAAQACNR
jgi:cytochrome c peroxidase